MAKIHVSELTGERLNNAVARALGWVDYPTDSVKKGDHWQCDPSNPSGISWLKKTYRPSTDWAVGGPIIESNGIDLYCTFCGDPKHKNLSWRVSTWKAKYHRNGFSSEQSYGPTPLIAAMRCFVETKLGKEIDEELLK